MSTTAQRPGVRRQRNRRGQGSRLRDDLVAGAVEMIEESGAQHVSLRGVARRVGITATSVYLHFPDVDHLLAAVMRHGFDELTAATARAAVSATGPLDELRRRCKAYCDFAVEHPKLYAVMFQDNLPDLIAMEGADTPGRHSFENLVKAVRRCLESGAAPPHDDAFRLASLIWSAEHGIVLARCSRPSFPWAPLHELVDEMVDRMMAVR